MKGKKGGGVSAAIAIYPSSSVTAKLCEIIDLIQV